MKKESNPPPPPGVVKPPPPPAPPRPPVTITPIEISESALKVMKEFNEAVEKLHKDVVTACGVPSKLMRS